MLAAGPGLDKGRAAHQIDGSPDPRPRARRPLASGIAMNSRQRVEAALHHQQPDHVPLDLGASPVTRHARQQRLPSSARPWGSTRRARRSRSSSPTRCSARSHPTCQNALGVDVGRPGRTPNDVRLREHGLEALDDSSTARPCWCPGCSTPSPSANGDILMYPEGDRCGRPAGGCPRAGSTSTAIVRQEPIDERTLERRGQPGGVRPGLRRRPGSTSPPRPSGCGSETERAILANFGGTAFGDIALVPAPWLKHPKGIRDVAEWYMSTAARFDYVYEVFRPPVRDRPGEPGEDLRRGGRPGHGRLRHRHRLRHAERAVHQPQRLPQALPAVPPPRQRLGPRSTRPGRRSSTPAARCWRCCRTSSRPASTSSTRCSVRRPAWTRRRSRTRFGERITFWGGGVDTQKTLPFGTPDEVRGEVRERIEIFGRGGGFVFNTVHNVQAAHADGESAWRCTRRCGSTEDCKGRVGRAQRAPPAEFARDWASKGGER